MAFDGKEKTLSIGKYPHLSLVEARECPQSQAKQQAKAERQAALLNTFEHQNNISRWKPNHAQRIMRYLEQDVFPHIGSSSIQELTISKKY